jgi:hypothetical protein
MSYPCEELSVWWVVYRVNPHEQLHTPDDSGYHENQVAAREVDEVYQVLGMQAGGHKDPQEGGFTLLG